MRTNNKLIKIIIYILLIINTLAHSQEKYLFTVGFDPKLALNGAYEDVNSTIDLIFSAQTGIGNNYYGLQIEYADLEPYYFSTGFIYDRYITSLKSIEMFAGGELIYLQRGFRRKQSEFIAYGINLTARKTLLGVFGISLRLNYKRRPDLIKTYNGDKFKLSGYFEINYIINR